MQSNISNKRGDKKSPQKKTFDLKKYKNNTLKSLNDVEYFLNNYKKFKKLIRLYKIFK